MADGPGMQGVFTASMDELVSYRYVGCQAVALDADHAIGHTTVRSHLCTPGSLSSAALAISMLDAAGINVDPVLLLGLTQVDIQLYEHALDVRRLRTAGRVVRWARTQVFTECRFEDDASGRVIGAGAANWSVVAATPEGFTYTDMGPGHPESPATPSMLDAFELQDADGGGFVLPSLSPRVGAEVLHHGPMLVGTEQAALQAGAMAAGTDGLALRSSTMRIVRAGRKAPFAMTATVLTTTGDVVACRSEVTDGDGDTIAVAHFSYAR
jgi:acyl-coenzyme A thioesterase PaaI-like protein